MIRTMNMYVYDIHLSVSVYIFILNDIYTTSKVDVALSRNSCLEPPDLGDLGSGLTLESSQSSLQFHL